MGKYRVVSCVVDSIRNSGYGLFGLIMLIIKHIIEDRVAIMKSRAECKVYGLIMRATLCGRCIQSIIMSFTNCQFKISRY